MKKIKKVLVCIVIALILIFIAVTIGIKIHLETNETIMEVFPKHVMCVQDLYGYVKTIELAEKSNIYIDEDVKDEIYDFAKEIYELFEDTGYDATIYNLETAQLAFIYSYYGFDCDNIKEALRAFYIPEYKRFNSTFYPKEEYKTSDNEYDTMDMLRTMGETGYYLVSDWGIEESLIEWFNATIYANYNDEKKLMDYYDLMWLLSSRPELSSKLNVEMLEESLISKIEEKVGMMDKLLPTIFDVSDIEMCQLYSSTYVQYDADFLKETNDLYSRINSYDGFGYDIDDEICIFIMAAYLRDHYLVCGTIYNDFLNDNLSYMLHEHFEKNCKGYLED